MNSYMIYNKAAGQSEFLLYETVEDAPGGPSIDPYLATVVDRLLKRNGGVVEIRNTNGNVLSRCTRSQPY